MIVNYGKRQSRQRERNKKIARRQLRIKKGEHDKA